MVTLHRFLSSIAMIALMAIAGVEASAQSIYTLDLDKARSLLVGDGQRLWQLEVMRTVNADSSCADELPSYLFSANGTVERKSCGAESLIKRTDQWTISTGEFGEILLSIGEETFEMQVRAHGGTDFLLIGSVYSQRFAPAVEIELSSPQE